MAKIMAVINTTPDSFFDGGRYSSTDNALKRAETALSGGAHILDIGGASSRPGAQEGPPDEEIRRVVPVVEAVRKHFPEAVVSVDTWRAAVAREAVGAGAHILNDISAGSMDEELLPAAADLKVPYMLIVGEKEAEENMVSVRKHGQGDLGSMPLEAFGKLILSDIESQMSGN